jgi:ketosteroid isomerase-like protein
MLTFAWVLVFVCTANAVGLPRPHKEARQQIEELEQQWRVATLAADVPAMDRLLSEDYVGISWNGQLNTKAMQLDRTRNRSFALTRLDLSDEKVKLVGRSVAVVTARAEVAGTSEGTDMKGTFRYTRVYQRLASGAWKITNFEATRVPDAGFGPHHNHNG